MTGQAIHALVLVAHPDDAEFWLGGTVASWIDAGLDVAYCVVTDGDAGGFDQDVARRDIPQIRRDEQVKAAASLGVREVRFLGLAEGSIDGASVTLVELAALP